MTKSVDGTKVAPHGLFYMENAGGLDFERSPPLETSLSSATDERQPSCFAFEEERGGSWKGAGTIKPAINEVKPSL